MVGSWDVSPCVGVTEAENPFSVRVGIHIFILSLVKDDKIQVMNEMVRAIIVNNKRQALLGVRADGWNAGRLSFLGGGGRDAGVARS